MRLLYTLVAFLTLFATSLHKPCFASNWEKTNLTSNYIESIKTTPWAILAGELDGNYYHYPYNGIYISKDFGKSWSELGLENRGITGIAYASGKIYASTYYFVDGKNGLYISEDKGRTWKHSMGNFSATTVDANNNLVLLGGYNHGLWVSQDQGETWEQKIGSGWYGPKVLSAKASDNLSIVGVENDVYISKDNGDSWNKVIALKDQRISSIEITKKTILVGSNNNSGMYKSSDNGNSWKKVNNWGDFPVGAIKYFDGVFYASKRNPQTLKYDIYKSEDFGETWLSTSLNSIYNQGITQNLQWVFSNPCFMLASVPLEGIYKYEIPDPYESQLGFLEIPWKTENNGELIDKIYSYFDHKYPLLGYSFFSEPDSARNTTLNYLGQEEPEPKLFYSSHDGYDFTLNYGTPIQASYSGYASYGYDPDGLGHFIKINHQNGYETTYAHLQENGLVTTGQNVWVDTKDVIGAVGMSGNTTGPHLHFSIKRLNVENPGGRLDPFGWSEKLKGDPWQYFSWEDIKGLHRGIKSLFLWKVNPKTASLANKKVIVENNATEDSFTVFIEPYAYPKIPVTQNKLTYITGTSMLVNIYNMLGQKIPELFEPSKIEIDLTNANTENIFENTLKIYTLNEETSLWEPVPSIYDFVARKIAGKVTHFSKFAVFGISKDNWQDQANIHSVKITT